MFKPMLAHDWDESKVLFPLYAQPKIDGVRGLNINGQFKARSLKLHGNKVITNLFSQPELAGFDGELVSDHETHPDLCRKTSSVVRKNGDLTPTKWHIFDLHDPAWAHKSYAQRRIEIEFRYNWLKGNRWAVDWVKCIELVPEKFIRSMEELLAFEKKCLELGYEGVILRHPMEPYKYGRSSPKTGGLLRIKRFTENEALVVELEEGKHNTNGAETNELGKTFRRTFADGMEPNGQVGTLICERDGKQFRVSPGEMDHETRIMYFKNPKLIIGKTITYKSFPKGVKDKPRFPTFKCIRDDHE